MIRQKRTAFLALCFLLAACATAPDSAPVRTVEITPSAALDDDLKKLDQLVLSRDFLAVPTYRDRVEMASGPVDVLRSYEFRSRRALKVSIGWELKRSRYRLFMTDTGRGGDEQTRSLECRKYGEIFADVLKTFGAGRVVPAAPESCDAG